MVGIFSFLLLASIIAFVVAVVLLVVRILKKKPKKPVVIAAAASVVLFLVSSVGIGVTYHPTPEQIAERERKAAEKAEKKAEQERLKAAEAEQQQSAPSESVNTVTAQTEESETAETQESSAVSPAPTEASSEQPVVSETTEPAETEPSSVPVESNSEQSEPEFSSSANTIKPSDFIESNRTGIVVSSKMILDDFISNYKIPLASQLWTIAKFDDAGAVIAGTDITEKSTQNTVFAFVVITPIVENGKMTGATPHFVAVGDVVYGDDGYCNEVFSLIAEMFEGLK